MSSALKTQLNENFIPTSVDSGNSSSFEQSSQNNFVDSGNSSSNTLRTGNSTGYTFLETQIMNNPSLVTFQTILSKENNSEIRIPVVPVGSVININIIAPSEGGLPARVVSLVRPNYLDEKVMKSVIEMAFPGDEIYTLISHKEGMSWKVDSINIISIGETSIFAGKEIISKEQILSTLREEVRRLKLSFGTKSLSEFTVDRTSNTMDVYLIYTVRGQSYLNLHTRIKNPDSNSDTILTEFRDKGVLFNKVVVKNTDIHGGITWDAFTVKPEEI